MKAFPRSTDKKKGSPENLPSCEYGYRSLLSPETREQLERMEAKTRKALRTGEQE